MKMDNAAFDRHSHGITNIAEIPTQFRPFVLPGFKSISCRNEPDDFFYQFRMEPQFLIGEHRFKISQDRSISSSLPASTGRLSFILEGSFSVNIPGFGLVDMVAGQAHLFLFPKDVEIISSFNPNCHRIIHFDLDPNTTQKLQSKISGKRGDTGESISMGSDIHWRSYTYSLRDRGTLQAIFDNSNLDEDSRSFKQSRAISLIENVLAFNRPRPRKRNVFTKISYRPEVMERIAQAKQIMDFWEGKPISILNLGKLTLLNEKTLKIGFKEMFGKTIYGYQIYIRLERSRKLLSDTSMSVAEIAHSVGYDDHSSFTKKFKMAFKIAPLQYRNSMASDAIMKNYLY
ncbi:MAG: helix-turn-helix transcriptional regulator [Chitinophagaceae bacterium]